MRTRTGRAPLPEAYRRMRAAFGYQQWWPAESPFEVCVGAILTQNTAWTNVTQALDRLRSAEALTAERLADAPMESLETWLKPSGYFRVKAARVRHLARLWRDGGGLALFDGDLVSVRERVLSWPGVGPETADCMLLYAGHRPVFVIDAYTRRIFQRHGWVESSDRYEALRAQCEAQLHAAPEGMTLTDYWGDYHAQLVAVGKDYCRPRRPHCEACPLRSLLPKGGPEIGEN